MIHNQPVIATMTVDHLGSQIARKASPGASNKNHGQPVALGSWFILTLDEKISKTIDRLLVIPTMAVDCKDFQDDASPYF